MQINYVYIFIFLFFAVVLYSLGKAFASTLIFYIALIGCFVLPVSVIQTSSSIICATGGIKIFFLPINILVIVASLYISWLLASKSENMETINGIGARLVANHKMPGKYIATKWLVLMYLPILPIKSYEVFGEQQGQYFKTYYSMRPLNQLAEDEISETRKKFAFWYWLLASILIGLSSLGVFVEIWKCS